MYVNKKVYHVVCSESQNISSATYSPDQIIAHLERQASSLVSTSQKYFIIDHFGIFTFYIRDEYIYKESQRENNLCVFV